MTLKDLNMTTTLLLSALALACNARPSSELCSTRLPPPPVYQEGDGVANVSDNPPPPIEETSDDETPSSSDNVFSMDVSRSDED